MKLNFLALTTLSLAFPAVASAALAGNMKIDEIPGESSANFGVTDVNGELGSPGDDIRILGGSILFSADVDYQVGDDLTGDGVPDLIVGSGPGGPPTVLTLALDLTVNGGATQRVNFNFEGPMSGFGTEPAGGGFGLWLGDAAGLGLPASPGTPLFDRVFLSGNLGFVAPSPITTAPTGTTMPLAFESLLAEPPFTMSFAVDGKGTVGNLTYGGPDGLGTLTLVPEPASLGLIAVGGGLCLARRRR